MLLATAPATNDPTADDDLTFLPLETVEGGEREYNVEFQWILLFDKHGNSAYRNVGAEVARLLLS